jgi:predicted HAD superfamily phosphohydrolase YqeG
MKRALKEMDVTPRETLVMGDQIFTDVLAGNSLGAFTVLVPPIKDKRDPLTRFKRLLERPILKRIKMKGKAAE